ncbi:MAG TPA: ABC transporter permease [Thermoplasmata archaeon]|nr:ABC transporter permease [Thermoplasmata archaeon]
MPNLLRLIYRNIVVNTDPGSLIILVGLPGMYLVFFGYGFQSISGSGGAGGSYLAFLTPGIMAFQVVMAGTVGGSMLWADRRWGMLSQLLVGPFTRLQYLLGIMLTSLLFGLGGAFVMLGVAFALLGTAPTGLIALAVIFASITLGSIFFGALMLFISALVKSNTAYNSVQILLIFIVNFASTVFYPLSAGLPLALKVLFEVNPLTYVADAVRGGYSGTLTTTDVYQLGILLAETIVILFLAVRSYLRSDVSYE